MGKRIWLLFVIFVLTLSTGCELNFSGSSKATPSGPSLDELSTLSALSTQAYTTPTLDGSLTSTPVLDIAGQGGELPTATITPKPTKTSMPGTIKITSITQKSPGLAIVKWDAVGDFPYGFKIVFTEVQSQPTYPESNFTTISSSSARAGVINYVADRIYYVRVCRFMSNSCDLYSDLGIFAYAPPTKTPKPTKTASSVVINGTAVPFDPTLVITMIKGGSNGKAYFEWKDSQTEAKGYKIVYSTTSTTPTLGTDSVFVISDPKARSAYVDGASATKYYYRICRYTGTDCNAYSAVYTFTFPTIAGTSTATSDASSITITSITNTDTGVAQVNWSATGTFPNGFKILYSKTNALPTLSDNVTVVSDGSVRVGSITGDPSALYHVRVCKYSGTDCTIYSPVFDFTFDADPIAINLISAVDGASPGDIDLTWSISGGTTPNGFKILLSSNATPDLTNSTVSTAANGDTTATVTGTTSTLYYVRICKSLGSTCGVYSNILSITTVGP